MLRYLKLYTYFVKFSVSRAMEFRLDFFFRIVMDTMYYVVNILFYKIVFIHTNVLAGWTEPQVMIFISGALIIDAIQMTVISNNMYWLPMMVNKGDLDYYLVRPVSSLFFVSLRDFAVNSFLNLFIAVGILIWSALHYPGPFGAGRVLLYLFLLMIGSLIYFCVRVLFVLPVFWTHSARGMDMVFWPLTRFMERPDRIFTGWVRKLLLTVLPFAVMSSVPARLVIDGFEIKTAVNLALVTAVFFILLINVWNYALKNYSSASS
jgi:ABC-2 type transport system permease protein